MEDLINHDENNIDETEKRNCVVRDSEQEILYCKRNRTTHRHQQQQQQQQQQYYPRTGRVGFASLFPYYRFLCLNFVIYQVYRINSKNSSELWLLLQVVVCLFFFYFRWRFYHEERNQHHRHNNSFLWASDVYSEAFQVSK